MLWLLAACGIIPPPSSGNNESDDTSPVTTNPPDDTAPVDTYTTDDTSETGDTTDTQTDVCAGVSKLWFNPDPFVIEGEEAYDAGGGIAVSSGDLDGDGVNDLVLGFSAAWNDAQETSGKVYGVLGGGNIAPGDYLLVSGADLEIDSNNNDDEWGLGADLKVNDLDADGKPDLLVSAAGLDGAHVVYNPLDQSPTTAVLQGGGIFGPHLFVIPDVDDPDGPGELVVGGNGQFDIIPLQEFSGTQSINGLRQYHAEGGDITTVSAGDMDGDGLAEVSFGDGYDDSTGIGKGYLVQGGSWTSTVNLRSDNLASGADVFTVTGTDWSQFAGSALAMGDVDNDGLSDWLVGASGEDNGHENSGGLHKLSSQGMSSSFYGTTMSLGIDGTLDLPQGLAVYGNDTNSALPNSIAVINDTECGLSAIVAGVDDTDSAFILSAATLAGLVGATDATVNEADQELEGEEGSEFGKGVYAIGDVNGDGVPDFATVSMGTDLAGKVYVYLGERI